MKQTSNYQLNQWDAQDRILREDFNADNEKLDAALAEINQDVQQSLQQLEDKAGYQLITTQSLTSTAQGNAVFSLTDVDWSQWGTVHLLLTPAFVAQSYPRVYINNSLSCQLSEGLNSWLHVILYPVFTPTLFISGLAVDKQKINLIHFTTAFSAISNITVRSDSPVLGSGSKLEVWGLK